jgi:uncharacterized protein
MDTQNEPNGAFDLDGMLGKLAKWLRIMGLDAAFPRFRPGAGRLFVTTNPRVIFPGTIIVGSDNVFAQLRQVISAAQIRLDPELFLSRCLICNVPVHAISLEDARAGIPGTVFQSFDKFTKCSQCGRIYWSGTHRARILRTLRDNGILI